MSQHIDALHDQVVVITGTGRLGSAVARLFARTALQGMILIGHRIQEAEALAETLDIGERALALAADLRLEDEVRAVFERAHARWGRLDVLVHTVGTWAGSPLLETSLESWEHLLALNLTSTFLCFREALRWMVPRRYGRLIAIASMQGADRARPQQAAYSASKAGLIRLVESVALEYRDSGITANAIAPSLILEPGQSGPGVLAESVAHLCLFLADKSSEAISGETIRIYGDYPVS
nr:MAG: beta-ketoacyl-ACP reductase [Bacteroidota bacterium]